MTKLLENAIEAARLLPSAAQDEIARATLHFAKADQNPEPIPTEHLPAVLEGLAQAKRREFATEAEVEEALRRFDR
ncbi:MAG TPA: hypothetical protein VHU15_15615 [Stellaceae bacterium]|jgi:hypothetical protein|nr:hypothetical protein [Stellaceae bacterium]